MARCESSVTAEVYLVGGITYPTSALAIFGGVKNHVCGARKGFLEKAAWLTEGVDLISCILYRAESLDL